MTLAIIYTAAGLVGIVIAFKSANAWSSAARSNSDMALGFTGSMAFAAACAWIAAALS